MYDIFSNSAGSDIYNINSLFLDIEYYLCAQKFDEFIDLFHKLKKINLSNLNPIIIKVYQLKKNFYEAVYYEIHEHDFFKALNKYISSITILIPKFNLKNYQCYRYSRMAYRILINISDLLEKNRLFLY